MAGIAFVELAGVVSGIPSVLQVRKFNPHAGFCARVRRAPPVRAGLILDSGCKALHTTTVVRPRGLHAFALIQHVTVGRDFSEADILRSPHHAKPVLHPRCEASASSRECKRKHCRILACLPSSRTSERLVHLGILAQAKLDTA